MGASAVKWLTAFLLLLFCADAEAANRFLTCNTTCTITASDTTIWGTTTGGTGASVPGSSDAVVLDGATCVGGTTCTATMGSGYNPTWQSITMGACTASTTGCIFDWSVNNNNVSIGTFSGTGVGTRNLKMGGGTWTVTGTGTAWNMSTTTGLTFNANSSSLVFTATSASTRTFQGGSLSYSTISLSANSSGGSFTIVGTNTIATLSIAPPFALFFPAVTTNITNAFSFSGSSSNQILLSSSTIGSVATLSTASGSASTAWTGIRDMTFSGGATFTATNSFNLGNNSGITITAPATGGGGRIIGGWLLRRDIGHDNDNDLAWLEKAV